MNLLRVSSGRFALPLFLTGWFLCLSGCSTTAHTAHTGEQVRLSPSPGRILKWEEVQTAAPGITLGNRTYAEVSSAWLHRWYRTYRAELFRVGVLHWDSRFDSNRFAGFFVGLAQTAFYKELFHAFTPADALAMGPFWYYRDRNGGGHAVVQVLTERGRIFIDPQTGEEVELSPTEMASAFLQFF